MSSLWFVLAKVREGFGTGKNPVRVAGRSTWTKAKGLEPDVLHLFLQLFVEVERELLGGRIVARVLSSQQQNGHFNVTATKISSVLTSYGSL